SHHPGKRRLRVSRVLAARRILTSSHTTSALGRPGHSSRGRPRSRRGVARDGTPPLRFGDLWVVLVTFGSYDWPMLFGRQNECERIDQLLAVARAGRSEALVLRGEAGIGKSALCGYAAQQAHDMTVLRASGAPTESELAFSGLADVLGPLLSAFDKLPAQQAVALTSALAIGPPAPIGRYAICAATLGVLGAAAEDGAVLVIVDEAESLDRSS